MLMLQTLFKSEVVWAYSQFTYLTVLVIHICLEKAMILVLFELKFLHEHFWKSGCKTIPQLPSSTVFSMSFHRFESHSEIWLENATWVEKNFLLIAMIANCTIAKEQIIINILLKIEYLDKKLSTRKRKEKSPS